MKTWHWPAWTACTLLVGLEALQMHGMHRDINRQNLLFLSRTADNRPHAVLNDLGKVTFSQSSHEEGIGNIYYLPPEIIPGELKRYTQSIDIWMLGFALIETFFSFARQSHVRRSMSPRIGQNHKEIVHKLNDVQGDGKNFAWLLWCMLEVQPENRPTATQMIESPLWQDYLDKDELEYLHRQRHSKKQTASTTSSTPRGHKRLHSEEW